MTAPASPLAGGAEHRYRRLIDAHFSGRLSAANERDLRAHLVTCGACRDRYDRHLLLAQLDPDAAVPMRDRLARGLGLSTAAPHRRSGRAALVGLTAVAALCALVVGLRPRGSGEFQRRGAVPGSQLLVYELSPGQTPRPATSRVHAGAGLAFAYANIGHKRRLLVFAVDENRQVYWYQPTWHTQAENPVAVEIAVDDALHEIPQAVTHRFAGRRLRLFGVFLDRGMSAREMEALVARAPSDGQGRVQVRIDGADVTGVDLVVSP